MKNWEKYEEEIKGLGINNFAVTEKGKVIECLEVGCHKCRFREKEKNCNEELTNWLYEEYEEPEVDWSKVPVDTPIYIKAYEDVEWGPRYFAKYEDGQVHAWAYGTTSFTALREGNTTVWPYAKLAEDTNERN